jgi:hypothetical protein
VEDLVDRITVMEDKANTLEITNQKQMKTKSTPTMAQTNAQMKELEKRLGKF